MNRCFSALPAYLGGKRRLAPVIFALLDRHVPRSGWRGKTFVDPFLGGGSVSLFAKLHGFRVICNDLALRSAVIGRAFIANGSVTLERSDVALLLREPDEPYPHLAKERHIPSVFSREHARLVDRVLYWTRRDYFPEPKRSLALVLLIKWALRVQPMSMLHGTDARAAFSGDYDHVSPRRVGHYVRSLDLSFVRDLVRECYEKVGRPSIDPVVFFKLHLIAFFERITSERHLMETAHLNLAHRWYLGYDLDEPLPDHSSLSKIRSRYGLEAFYRFFERVVGLCMEAGLVEGDELYLDATMVDANASVHTMRTRFSVVATREHVEKVFLENPAPEEPPRPSLLSEESGERPDRPPQEMPERVGASEAEAGRESRPSPFVGLVEAYRHGSRSSLRKSRYTRISDSRYSPTDPDAHLMKSAPGTRARLGYHGHYVVDGGKGRVVLAALVTPGHVMENAPMLDLVRQVRFRWRLRPRQATGDTTYGTIEDVKGLEDDGIRAFVPLPDFSQRTGYFPAEVFIYDGASDRYICPQGQELCLRVHRHSDSVLIYQAKGAVCNVCPIKGCCTASSNGRQVFRSMYQSYPDKVKGYRQLPSYERALRKRKVWLEPLFAEAKVLHGLRRFRLRGLHKVNMEGLIVAAGQNLKRLLNYWGARRWPTPSSLAAAIQPLCQRLIRRPTPAW